MPSQALFNSRKYNGTLYQKLPLYSLKRNCLPNAEHFVKDEARFVKIIQSTWHIRESVLQ